MSWHESFIAGARWQYAKSMPDWPHEYTVKTWRPDLIANFERFCQLIEAEGEVEPWPPPPEAPIYHNRYLTLGEYKYWAMGPKGDADLPEERTVINRARVPSDRSAPATASAEAAESGIVAAQGSPLEEDGPMRLDPWLDFRTDTPGGFEPDGKDPDAYSPTLRRYHQTLWSKPLPSGEVFELNATAPGVYLLHNAPTGDMQLSSDAAVPTFAKNASHLREHLPTADIERFDYLQYTIGGMMLWPSTQQERQHTINQARGFDWQIKDRIDLTVECVRRHYAGDDAPFPLQAVLKRYDSFFELFGTFSGFVEFFLLQDLVCNGQVEFFLPFHDFSGPALPQGAEDYRWYMDRASAFIEARNHRIDALEIEIPDA
jgi:hypothetical protein